MKKKNILLPSGFLIDVMRLIYSLDYAKLDSKTKSLCTSLESQIKAKLDAMERRDVFTKYKTASQGSDERELYRKEYLDKAGIHKDWISSEETPLLPY